MKGTGRITASTAALHPPVSPTEIKEEGGEEEKKERQSFSAIITNKSSRRERIISHQTLRELRAYTMNSRTLEVQSFARL